MVERVTSGFPLSIGTSLAFESLYDPIQSVYDPNREIPKRVDMSKYDSFYIHIDTLFRNVIGAIDDSTFQGRKDGVFYTSAEEFANILTAEMEIIKSVLVNGGGTIRPFFYTSDHSSFINKYSGKAIEFRVPTTEKQLLYSHKLKDTLRILKKSIGEGPDGFLTVSGGLKPVEGRARALVLTSDAIDLLSYNNFKVFDLIESHTGVLKDRYSFSTKYLPIGKNKVDFFPWSKELLLVFGDKGSIRPFLIDARRQLYDIGIKYKFTPYTTRDKVRYYINQEVKEEYFRRWFMGL